MKNREKIFRTAMMGLFAAATLTLSYAESLITSFLPLPPGVKPGLANIAVTFVCLSLGYIPAVILILIKAGFVFLINGFSAAAISCAGGFFSVSATAVLLKLKKKNPERLSFVGVSVFAAICNNAGQLAAASCLVGSSLYLAYAPVLLFSALGFGTVTGIIMNALMPALIHLKLFDKKTPEKDSDGE